MFVGRKKELKYLEENYAKEGSHLLVVYGHAGVGKTSLAQRFAAGKPLHYYAARACSEAEQLRLWNDELKEAAWEGGADASAESAEGFADIFKQATGAAKDKKALLVIDEFQHLIRHSGSFMPALIEYIRAGESECMVLLLSSSISFVENDFVPKIGSLALGISAFYKLGELGFMDCVNYFKDYSTRQCMEAYSILGGIPAYWAAFDPARGIKENICEAMLASGSPLRNEGERMVLSELREMNVYSVLLCAMSCGMNKLNDLHERSGFSRAKISVYLKNLMERQLVEKVFAFDNASSANARKGVYRVSLRYLEFYFRFIFSKLSSLESMSAEAFYEKHVAGGLDAFHQGNFRKVCGEYLQILNSSNMLPIKASKEGEWIGKSGSIDIVLQDEEWDTILAFCEWEKKSVGMTELNSYLKTAEEARLHADHLYLFSAGSFDDALKAHAQANPNIKLIDIDTL